MDEYVDNLVEAIVLPHFMLTTGNGELKLTSTAEKQRLLPFAAFIGQLESHSGCRTIRQSFREQCTLSLPMYDGRSPSPTWRTLWYCPSC